MNGYDDFFKKAKVQSRSGQRPKRVSSTSASQRPSQAVPLNVFEERLKKAVNMKAKKKPKVQWKFAILSVLGVIVAALALVYVDDLDRLLGRFEVGVFGIADAQEKPEAKATGKHDPPNSPVVKAQKEKAPADALETRVSKSPWSEESIDHLKHLKDRKDELDAREARLNALETELQKQKQDLSQQLVEVQKVRTEIAGMLKDRVDSDDEKVDKLVEFYSNMKPQMSSKIFETLDEDLAVEVLGRMKKKNAAEIMNLLSAEKAQTLSEKFAGYRAK